VALEGGMEALVSYRAPRTDSLGELLALEAVFFSLGAVGGVKQ
jgi:hypothetical protein